MKHTGFDSNGEMTLTLTRGHLYTIHEAFVKASKQCKSTARAREVRMLHNNHFLNKAKHFKAYADEFKELANLDAAPRKVGKMDAAKPAQLTEKWRKFLVKESERRKKIIMESDWGDFPAAPKEN